MKHLTIIGYKEDTFNLILDILTSNNEYPDIFIFDPSSRGKKQIIHPDFNISFSNYISEPAFSIKSDYPVPFPLISLIHVSAYIQQSSLINENCLISAFVYIGANCTINNSIILQHATITDNQYLDNTIIQPNTVVNKTTFLP